MAIIYRRKIMVSVSQSVFPFVIRTIKSKNSTIKHTDADTQTIARRQSKKGPYRWLYNSVDGITYI